MDQNDQNGNDSSVVISCRDMMPFGEYCNLIMNKILIHKILNKSSVRGSESLRAHQWTAAKSKLLGTRQEKQNMLKTTLPTECSTKNSTKLLCLEADL